MQESEIQRRRQPYKNQCNRWCFTNNTFYWRNVLSSYLQQLHYISGKITSKQSTAETGMKFPFLEMDSDLSDILVLLNAD